MAKVTSKLQVTVPKALANQYGIRPGVEIEWEPAGDTIRVMSPARLLAPWISVPDCASSMPPRSARRRGKDRGLRKGRRKGAAGDGGSCTTVAALVDTNVLVYRVDPRYPAKAGYRWPPSCLRAGLSDDSLRVPHPAIVEFVGDHDSIAGRDAPLLSADDARRGGRGDPCASSRSVPLGSDGQAAIRGAATYRSTMVRRASLGLCGDLRTDRDLLRGFSARSPVRDGARRRSVPGPLTSARPGPCSPSLTGRVSQASAHAARLEVRRPVPDRRQSPSRSRYGQNQRR